jgi:signal transduction histidine kinase
VTGVPSGLGPGVELVVYRTVQEALTNVLKHARHPTRVRVALMYGSGQTVIEVEDDGAGLPAESDQHAGDRHGLTGMAERVAAYGGRLHACPVPVPGRGWRLRATVPTPKDPAPGEQQ